MKNLLTVLLLGLWVATTYATEKIQVYFSPHGGCTEAVVEQLNKAKTSAYIQAYGFTSAPIAKALLEAHRRGVKVSVILDKSQRTEKYSEADFLAHSGIPTYIDARHAVAHNKIIIADERIVLTGSFNFTAVAEEHNAENLLVIDDPDLAKKYLRNWKSHEAHSDPYAGHPNQEKGFWRSLFNHIFK
jgi:phosphatidylserine/phosphatidylglycerophosphate/cardiolipin synthase-like enzyme